MKWLVGVLLMLVVCTVALGIYLQPNDFARCPSIGEPVDRRGCDAADAIVAVSGGDTMARTQKAIDLYKAGWAPYIVFSGAAEDKTGPSNAAAMRGIARQQDVPAHAILVEEFSENTRQNAENTNELLANNNIHDIILVTSGYHQRRAYLEFQALTSEHGATIRNHPTSDKDWNGWWWLTPRGWYLAIGEFGRIIAFYARGGVL